MSFDEYAKLYLSNLTTSIPSEGYLLEVNSDDYFLGGLKAIRSIGILNMNNTEVKGLNYQTIRNGTVFGISAIAKVDEYQDFESIFKRIIESFRFNEQTDSNTTNIIKKGSYSNFGFSLHYPMTWTAEEIVGNNTFEEYYLQSSVKNISYPIVVISKNNDQVFSNMSFDEYTKWNLETLTNPKSSYGFHPVEVNSDDYFLGGVKAIRSITLTNNDDIEVKDLSYQTIKNGINFGIHALSKIDQFEEYQPIFNRIIESFRFNEQTDSNTTNTSENQNSSLIKTKDQEIQKRSNVKSLQDDFVVLVILKPSNDSIASESESIDKVKQKNIQELPEKPKEIKQISLNVFLDTHIYTLFDQRVSVRLYNSNGQFDSHYLKVPDTGGMTDYFNIDELNVPKGTVFTVCVTNEGNDKEDCQTVNRGYGDYNINVRMTVP